MLFENMKESASLHLVVPGNLGGQRLDLALQQMLPDHSRSRLQAWIKEELVLLDGKATTAKTKVWGGEKLDITPPKNAQEKMAGATPPLLHRFMAMYIWLERAE